MGCLQGRLLAPAETAELPPRPHRASYSRVQVCLLYNGNGSSEQSLDKVPTAPSPSLAPAVLSQLIMGWTPASAFLPRSLRLCRQVLITPTILVT